VDSGRGAAPAHGAARSLGRATGRDDSMTRLAKASLTVALTALLLGCGGGAKELLDTAQLEETQRNVPHARELYEEVVRRYPGTPEAETAKARLEALGKAN
jgi:hypothetical protein